MKGILKSELAMGIASTFDQERNLLLTTAEGTVTYEEIYNHLIEERKSLGLGYPEIIDSRTATPDVTAAEVRALVMFLQGLGHVKKLGPTAFIVSTAVAFGVVRMAGTLCGGLCPIAPFWKEEDALTWIAQGAPIKSIGA